MRSHWQLGLNWLQFNPIRLIQFRIRPTISVQVILASRKWPFSDTPICGIALLALGAVNVTSAPSKVAPFNSNRKKSDFGSFCFNSNFDPLIIACSCFGFTPNCNSFPILYSTTSNDKCHFDVIFVSLFCHFCVIFLSFYFNFKIILLSF